MIGFVFQVFLISRISGHGLLVTPVPRFGPGDNMGQDIAPVPTLSENFVCRHPETDLERSQIHEVTAGTNLTVQWSLTADHDGDCAIFISYDVDKPRMEQEFFKIANFYECKDWENQDLTIELPSWLPNGPAVFRWDWYGLHLREANLIEFFVQCFDAVISGSDNTITKDDIFTYTIPGLYPDIPHVKDNYRDPFPPLTNQYITGPPCARGFEGNQCDRTACGTPGFIDVMEFMENGGSWPVTRRSLRDCVDIKPSSECESQMASWDICSSSWWASQCEKTCGHCVSDEITTTSAVCLKYEIDGGDVVTTGIESTVDIDTAFPTGAPTFNPTVGTTVIESTVDIDTALPTVAPTVNPTIVPEIFDSLTKKDCREIKQWYLGSSPRPGWFDIIDYMHQTYSIDVSVMPFQTAKTEFLVYCASL